MKMICDTYEKMLQQGRQLLSEAEVEEAWNDSFLLFSHVTGMKRADYFLRQKEKPDAREVRQFFEQVEKRRTHIPLQYITGEQEFMGLSFSVDEHVLIPRQDTEILVETVLPYSSGRRVLDLCTGSGCIAISVAVLGNPEQCTGTDISASALQLAKENAEKNEGNVRFIQSDLFAEVSGTFDLIVSNPPYISSEKLEELMEEVKDHEPRLALDGGLDGLSFYRRIIGESRAYLNPGGMLFFEIGYDQAEAVEGMMQDAGYVDIVCKKDYAGLDRVVYGLAGWKRA